MTAEACQTRGWRFACRLGATWNEYDGNDADREYREKLYGGDAGNEQLYLRGIAPLTNRHNAKD